MSTQQNYSFVWNPCNVQLYNQLKLLIDSLGVKKQNRTVKNEINRIVHQVGRDAEIGMFEVLLESIDFKDHSQAEQNPKGQFLSQQLMDFAAKPGNSYFLDYFSSIVYDVMPSATTVGTFVNDIIKFLKLPGHIQWIFYLSMIHSYIPEIRQEGIQKLGEKIQEQGENLKPLIMPNFSSSIICNLLYTVRNQQQFLDLQNEIKFLAESIDMQHYVQEMKPLLQLDDSQRGCGPLSNSREGQINLLQVQPQIKLNSVIKPWEVLRDLGPQITQNSQNMSSFLKELESFTDQDVLECLIFIANNSQLADEVDSKISNTFFHTQRQGTFEQWNKFVNENQADKKTTTQYNSQVFIQSCIQNIDQLNLNAMLQKLNQTQITLKDEKCMIAFLKFFGKTRKNQANFAFPTSILFEPWDNKQDHVNFLLNLLKTEQPDLINWNDLKMKIVNMDYNPNFKYTELNSSFQIWASLDLLQTLIQLSEGSDHFVKIREAFDVPINRCPDILIIGLGQISPQCGDAMLDEILSQLFPTYLTNNANSLPLLESLWKHNQQMFISAICELYRRENKKESSSLNLSRVLDITQQIKGSQHPITNCHDYNFSVSFGILAGKREFLFFDQWIQERIKAIGGPFIQALLHYLEQNLMAPIRDYNNKYNGQQSGQHQQNYEAFLDKAQLTPSLLAIINERLLGASDKLSQKNERKFIDMYKELCEIYPDLKPQLIVTQEGGCSEIEGISNSFFEQLYKSEVTIEAALDQVKSYQNSTKPNEKDIYACIITELLSEFKFHDQYPEKQLQITGDFFGSLIFSGVIQGKSLQICFEQIFDSLMSNTAKRFQFGIRSIKAIKEQIYDFADFVCNLFQIKNLQEREPEILLQLFNHIRSNNLIEYVDRIKDSTKEQLQDKIKAKQEIALQHQQNQQILELQQNQPKRGNNSTGSIGPLNQIGNSSGNINSVTFENNQSSTDNEDLSPMINNGRKIQDLNHSISDNLILNLNQPNNNQIGVGLTRSVSTGNPSTTTNLNNNGGLIFPQQSVNNNNNIINSGGIPPSKIFNNNTNLINVDSSKMNPSQSQPVQNLTNQQSQSQNTSLSAGALPNNQGAATNMLFNNNAPNFSNSSNNKEATNANNLGSSSSAPYSQGNNNTSQRNFTTSNNPQQSAPTNQNTSGVNNNIFNQPIFPQYRYSHPDQIMNISNMFTNGEIYAASEKRVNEIIQEETSETSDYYSNKQSDLQETQIIVPNAVQNNLRLQLNHMTSSQDDRCAAEIRNTIAEKEEYRRWCARNIIQRATQFEKERIRDYIQLLNSIQRSDMWRFITIDSYRLLVKMLHCERVPDTVEQNKISSIGTWFGLITLSRNKPILTKYLNLKQLLLQSYLSMNPPFGGGAAPGSSGNSVDPKLANPPRFTYILNPIIKILEAHKESTIFQLGNPWLNGIIGLLDEIKCELQANPENQQQRLEIEVFYKHSNIGPQDLEKMPQYLKQYRTKCYVMLTQNQHLGPERIFNTHSHVDQQLLHQQGNNIISEGGAGPATNMYVYNQFGNNNQIGGAVNSSGISGGAAIGLNNNINLNNSAAIPGDYMSDFQQGPHSGTHSNGGETSSMDYEGADNLSVPNGMTMTNNVSTRSNSLISTQHVLSVPPGGSGLGLNTGSMSQQQLVIPNLPEFVTIDNRNLGIYQTEKGLNLQMIVAQAVDAAIQDIIPPVISRSVTIALITTRELALKDFCKEPNEKVVLKGTNLMVQKLSGSLALVTCREPLRMSLQNHLKNLLDKEHNLSDRDKETIIQVAAVDNLDLGCSLIRKAVMEKALEDVNQDQNILDGLEKRKLARERKELYFDPNYNTNVMMLPEALRPQPGGLSSEELKIYQDFGAQNTKIKPTGAQGGAIANPAVINNLISGNNLSSNISISQVPSSSSVSSNILSGGGVNINQGILNNANVVGVSPLQLNHGHPQVYVNNLDNAPSIDDYQALVLNKFNFFLYNMANQTEQNDKSEYDMIEVRRNTEQFIQEIQCIEDIFNDMAMKVYMQLFESSQESKVELCICILEILRDQVQVGQRLGQDIKTFILKENLLQIPQQPLLPLILNSLLKRQLLSLPDYEEILKGLLENKSLEIQNCVTETLRSVIFEDRLLMPQNVSSVIEFLREIVKRSSNPPEVIKSFLDELRQYPQLTSLHNNQIYKNNNKMSNDFEFIVILNEVSQCFSETKQNDECRHTAVKYFENFLSISNNIDEINQFMTRFNEMIAGMDEEQVKKLFVYLIDICITESLDSLNTTNKSRINEFENQNCAYIDALTTLINQFLQILVSDHHDYIERICHAFLIVFAKYHQQSNFNQRPFFKFIFNILYDLRRPDFNFDQNLPLNLLHVFINLLDKIQPLKFPGFSYAWVELISSRYFMPIIFSNHDYWIDYHVLILDLLKFYQEISIDEIIAKESFSLFYKGTLRVLLILLNDFPDFLSEFSFVFCDEVPERFTQVRNIILSAFPQNTRPPDPYTINFENYESNMEDFKELPVYYNTLLQGNITSLNLHNDINNYLKDSSDQNFKTICNQMIKFESNTKKINCQVVNIFTIAVPWLIKEKLVQSSQFDALEIQEFQIRSFDIFLKIFQTSTTELKDCLINAIMNQIRYPNFITHYYIQFVFKIFMDGDEQLQQKFLINFSIRTKVQKPIPWGIMYAFYEIVQNQKMNTRNKPYFKKSYHEETINRIKDPGSNPESG